MTSDREQLLSDCCNCFHFLIIKSGQTGVACWTALIVRESSLGLGIIVAVASAYFVLVN